MLTEELEQGDGILFDTSLAPRTGDLALCDIGGERVMKYIRKQSRELFLSGGGTRDTIPVDGDTDAKVLGIVTVLIKVRRFKKRRTKAIIRLPQKEQPMLFERRAIKAIFFPDSAVPAAGHISSLFFCGIIFSRADDFERLFQNFVPPGPQSFDRGMHRNVDRDARALGVRAVGVVEAQSREPT